jgi:hypothetical protein
MRINSSAEVASAGGTQPAGEPEAPGAAAQGRSPRKRRGVTALEYLVALSFIIVMAIVAIQHIGAITGGLLQNSANTTTK